MGMDGYTILLSFIFTARGATSQRDDLGGVPLCAGLDDFICQQLTKHCPEASLEAAAPTGSDVGGDGGESEGAVKAPQAAGNVHTTHPHEAAELPRGAPTHDEL